MIYIYLISLLLQVLIRRHLLRYRLELLFHLKFHHRSQMFYNLQQLTKFLLLIVILIRFFLQQNEMYNFLLLHYQFYQDDLQPYVILSITCCICPCFMNHHHCIFGITILSAAIAITDAPLAAKPSMCTTIVAE